MAADIIEGWSVGLINQARGGSIESLEFVQQQGAGWHTT
jgi:hypothetical protein